MLEQFGWFFLSVVILTATAIFFAPQRAQCPHGFWINGVRPSGSFECMRDRDPNTDNEHSRGHDEIDGRIECPVSFMPIVVGDTGVECRSASTIP